MQASIARLVLIRHGESVANAEERFTRGPDEPLSSRGRVEAQEIARFLADRFGVSALYSSPFRRALETAHAVGEGVGLSPIVIDSFREQDFGRLRGRPYDLLRGDPAARGASRWSYRPPGGESLEEVVRRVGPALDDVARRHAGQVVVVVSHGGVMAALRAWARGGFDAPPVVTPSGRGFILERKGARYLGPIPLEEHH